MSFFKIVCVILLLGGSSSALEPSSLDIRISNLVSTKQSRIHLAFYKCESDFPDHPVKYSSLEIKDMQTVSFQIDGLEKGAYFIAAFQDLDLNYELNKNFIGIPKEPYGFSNNIRPGITGLKISNGFFNYPEQSTLEIKMY